MQRIQVLLLSPTSSSRIDWTEVQSNTHRLWEPLSG